MNTLYNPTTLNSVEAYKKYGIAPSYVRYTINNYFYYPYNMRDTLDKYYIMRWNVGYFLSKIKEGMIEHQDVEYQIIYHKTDPTKLHRVSGTHAQVKLSFRVADPLFNIPPTVLVAISPPKRR